MAPTSSASTALSDARAETADVSRTAVTRAKIAVRFTMLLSFRGNAALLQDPFAPPTVATVFLLSCCRFMLPVVYSSYVTLTTLTLHLSQGRREVESLADWMISSVSSFCTNVMASRFAVFQPGSIVML